MKPISWTLFILITTFLVSCQEKLPEVYNSSIIEKGKIDAVFDKDVSTVLFDHLYVVVDDLTYRALTEDSFWKHNYASLDLGLPNFTPSLENSSTCYLRGHRHYIEILGPDNIYNEPVGKSGIGFLLENNNEHFHLGMAPKLRGENDEFFSATETVRMPNGAQEQTWFKAFYTPSPGTALHTWYAFYNPAFLDTLHDQKHKNYTREAFLKDVYKDDRLFKGIHAIHLTCTFQDYNRIAQELRSLGCRLLEKNGEQLTIEIGDISITLTPTDKAKYSRITNLRCHLNKVENSVIQLGHLTITNSGKESVWEFNELYNELLK